MHKPLMVVNLCFLQVRIADRLMAFISYMILTAHQVLVSSILSFQGSKINFMAMGFNKKIKILLHDTIQ